MALSNYGELKTAVANWLHRSDLTSLIPDFIALAEARLQHDLGDILLMESAGTITTVAGTRTYAVPSGFERLRHVVDLRNVTADEIAQAYADNTAQGEPKWIAFDGTQFVIHPVPDAVYSYPYTAQVRFAAFSDDADTNTLLERYPGAYLFGALMEAAPYVEDDARVGLWAGKYAEAVANAKSVNHYGDLTLRTEFRSRGGYDINIE